MNIEHYKNKCKGFDGLEPFAGTTGGQKPQSLLCVPGLFNGVKVRDHCFRLALGVLDIGGFEANAMVQLRSRRSRHRGRSPLVKLPGHNNYSCRR